MKNTLEGINSRLDDIEEEISELEHRVVEIMEAEQKKKKNKINEDSLKDLWDNIKCTNILIIGVPEGEEKERGADNIFEGIIAENFPNLDKEVDTQVQEAESQTGSIQRGSHQDTYN